MLTVSAISPARAADAVAGQYRAAAGPDTAAELVLRPDGHFEFALEEGALDERAAGHWTRQGDHLVLTTLPKPVSPVFRRAPRSPPAAGAPTLRVTSSGHGIGGVDFRIGFDSGEPIVAYTQEYGWTLPADEHRIPRWIELADPIYEFASPRYPIEAGVGTLNFVIVPNDIGVADFSGVTIDVQDDGLVFHREGQEMKFVREARP